MPGIGSQSGGAINVGQPVNWLAPLNRGLKAWYKCTDQSSGARFIDLCGKYHTTLNAGAVFSGAKGKPSTQKALSLTVGSSQYAEGSGTPVIVPPFTMNIWFYSLSTALNQELFSLCSSTSDTPFANILIAATNVIFAQFRNDANTQVLFSTAATWVASTWNMATLVSRSGSDWSLFLNGGNEVTDSTSATGAVTLDRISIGRIGRPSSGNYFSGMLEDGRIYDRALSSSEVRSLYNTSRAGYLNELNWIRRGFGGAAVAAAFDPASSFDSNQNFIMPAQRLVAIGY